MILVRNIFQLKFGKATEAKNLIKESKDLMKKIDQPIPRYYTDLTGEFYTLVMELTFENLAAYEKSANEEMGSSEFKQWYQKFVPLVDSGRREIFTVVN